ncbi:MAG: extracellular solute-binding protein [Lentisphaerae bacterium]|nr:extracellular solute-binding protein [Lentisphaerota bacterium]
MKLREIVKAYLGAAIIVAAMIFAVVRVAYNQLTYEAADVTTLRMCHWQLEAGFRDALDTLIKEYETLYRERHGKTVRIIQMPIGERGYQQFMNTSLIGGTAPDIIEKGHSSMANDPSYVARFFRPLGNYADEPNPYNTGTPLEGVPWRETFVDGMQNAYDPQLLDYYFIPFSMFAIRIYYNRDLYRELTGRTEPPATFSEFIKACDAIKAAAAERGEPIVPIAGSKYQGNVFRGRYERPFLFDTIRELDDNLDGEASNLETWRGYRAETWHFDSPRMLAMYRCLLDVSENFQRGWLAALRDDAVFMFVQERAVMFASGSWDASSILTQVGDRFDVSIFDFPIPTDHPEYGKYVPGPVSEGDVGGSLPWAISKQTRQADLAIDFLRFCTTRLRNERFNEAITWIPVVRGADIAPKLKAFRPRIEGYSGKIVFDISTEAQLVMEGNRWPLFSGQMAPEEYAARAAEVYERTGVAGYRNQLVKDRRNARNVERVLAVRVADYYRRAEAGGVSNAVPEKILQLVASTLYFNHNLAADEAEFEALLAEEESTP